MRALFFLSTIVFLFSCWDKPYHHPTYNYGKVWGNKPIYSATVDAKQIAYIDSAFPVVVPGNIYAKGNRIYQLEIGRGIHVIDNSVPAQAHRIGFIRVNGSSQISIRDNYVYTNSYDDLVVIDISNAGTVTVVKRLPGAFPEGYSNYYLVQPEESGYYECPNQDSVVIGWRKDSVLYNCYKN